MAPGWDGDAPADATVIRLPTAIASIVGRWAVDGEADLPAVRELQDGLRLTPTAPGAGLPLPAEGVSDDLVFFEQLRVLMQAFPPADRGPCVPAPLRAARPARPGVAVRDPDAALHEALEEGLAGGRERAGGGAEGRRGRPAERVAS